MAKTFTISPTSKSISVGSSFYIYFYFDGDPVTAEVYSSPVCVTVGSASTSVKITGASAGSGTISCRYNNAGQWEYASCSVTVTSSTQTASYSWTGGNYTYDGLSHSPVYGSLVGCTASGDTGAKTNAGTYRVTFTCNSGYQFSDGTTTKTEYWYINQATRYASISISPTSYQWDGSTKSPTITYTYCSYSSGTTSASAIGSYTVYASKYSDTTNYKYVWSGSSYATWSITKATPSWYMSPSTVRAWAGDYGTSTIQSYSSSLAYSVTPYSLTSATISGSSVLMQNTSAGFGYAGISSAATTYYNSKTGYAYLYTYNKPGTATGLVYNGSAQQLLTSPASYTSTQTFYYAVSTSTTQPSSGWNSSYTSATGTGSASADTTYYVHVRAQSNYADYYVGYVTVTITGKPKAAWTSEPTSTSPTYNGNYHDLSTEGTSSQGTVKYRYRLSGGTWSLYDTAIPSAADAGTYNIEAYIVGDGSHQDSDHITFNTVVSQYQLDATITLASTMTYNSAERNLVSSGSVINPGTTTGKGTLSYALGANGTTAPTSGWSTSIPTGTNAGTYYVWYKVDSNDTTNCLSKSATYKGSVTINKKSITITAPTINTATLTYSAAPKTLASDGSVSDTTGATFKIGLGSSSSSAPSSWISSDTIEATNAGTYYVWYKAVLNDSTNYTVDTSNHYLGSKAIGKAALTVTGSSHTVTYGDATPTVSVSYSGFKGSDTAADVFSTLPTASTTYTSSTSVSASPVAVTVTAGSSPINYSVTYINGSITINKANPILTWIKKPTSVNYGSTTTDALEATVTGGGAITFYSGTTSVATINNSNQIVGVAAGSSTISADVAASTNYNAATGLGAYTFTVNKVSPTYSTAPSYSRPTYNASAQYLCSAATGVIGGTAEYYASTSSTSATGGSWSATRPTLTNCGTTRYIWWKIVGDTNHNDKTAVYIGTSSYIQQKTVTVTASSHTINYNANVPSGTCSYSGWAGSESESVLTTAPTWSTTYTKGSNVGTYPTTASGAEATNYTFTYEDGTITVQKIAAVLALSSTSVAQFTTQTVTLSSYVSAHTGTCTYAIKTNGTTTASTISGAVVTCGTMSSANDTNQSVVCTITDPGDTNHYQVAKDFTITVKKNTQTIAFNNSTEAVTYGSTLSVAATVTASHGTTGSLSYTTTGSYTSISGSTLTGTAYSGTSTDTITATAARTTTCSIATKTRTVAVQRRTVTLSWGTVTWTYDGATHSTTCTAGNLVGSDTCDVTLTGNSVGPNVGTVTVTASSLNNSNYALPTSTTNTLTINQREVTLSWGTLSWTYDGNTHSTTCNLGNLVGGDTCTVTLDGNSVGKNVGTATVTASSLSNGNYKLPSAKTNTLRITAKTATLSWGTTSWTYDGSTHATTCSVSNLVGGDTCTVTLDGNSVGKNVGSSTVTATALSNSNYALPSSASITISITQKAVTLSWGTTTWTYDKSEKTVTCAAGSLVTGDTCTVTLSNNKRTNAGSQTVTATGLSNGNYKLPSSGTTTTLTINQREVSLVWGTLTWVYDKSTHSTSATCTNVMSGDTCAVTDYTGNSVGPNVGSSTVTATALSNSNYKLPSSASNTISITQKTVTLSWGTHTWTYDGTEKTVTCSVASTSIITGDTCTVTGITGNKRTNAGTQTVTVTALSNSNYKLPSGPTTTLTINKFNLSATVTLSSTVVYNGSDRNLASGTVVNPGSTTGKGTLMFALGANGTTAPSSGWVTDNPIKRTNAGTYYIWYKVDAVDTTNCNSLVATYKGTVTINKANVTITITSPVSVSWTGTSGNSTSYTRNSNSSVTFSASTNFGTIVYASSDSSVATINSSGVLTCAYWGGSCTLTISVAGTDNYNGASGTVSLTTLNVSNTKIYIDGQWKTVTPYIYTADGWKRAVACIYTADGWKKC